MKSTRYYDKKGQTSEGTTRSKNAGCGNRSRCKNDPYGEGYQCDEFPFKSVDPEGEQPINRCVPAVQNNGKFKVETSHRERTAKSALGQSQVLTQFYNSESIWSEVGLDGKKGSFRLAFSNTGTSK